ncbi:hypothetical protein ACRAWD_22775 [Caulobacter segnis]
MDKVAVRAAGRRRPGQHAGRHGCDVRGVPSTPSPLGGIAEHAAHLRRGARHRTEPISGRCADDRRRPRPALHLHGLPSLPGEFASSTVPADAGGDAPVALVHDGGTSAVMMATPDRHRGPGGRLQHDRGDHRRGRPDLSVWRGGRNGPRAGERACGSPAIASAQLTARYRRRDRRGDRLRPSAASRSLEEPRASCPRSNGASASPRPRSTAADDRHDPRPGAGRARPARPTPRPGGAPRAWKIVREDVESAQRARQGRRRPGARAGRRAAPPGAVLLTSRVSIEMVQEAR